MSRTRYTMPVRLFRAIVFLFCVVLPGHASERTIKQYVHTSWTEKDGAPAGLISIAQTPDGYLWVSNERSLYRFDGVSFQPYEFTAPESVTPFSLWTAPDGDLWVGGWGTITCLSHGRQITYKLSDGVPNARVRGFATDATGTIWASTMGGPVYFSGNRWILPGKDWNFPGTISNGIFRDRHGTLWVVALNTIVSLAPGGHRFQPTGLRTGDVQNFAEQANGRLWLADQNGSPRPMPVPTSLPPSGQTSISMAANHILSTPDGSLWLATYGNGILRVQHPERLESRAYTVRDPSIELFTAKDGLTSDEVSSMLEDREGTIWVTTSKGIDCFRRGRVVPVIPLLKNQASLLTPADGGAMWIYSQGQMVRTTTGASFTSEEPRGEYVTSYRDHGGTVWWASPRELYRFKDGKFTEMMPAEIRSTPLPPALAHGDLSPPRMTEGPDGTLWLDLQGAGIYHLSKDGKWSRLDTPAWIASTYCNNAYTDARGRVWFILRRSPAIYIEGGKIHYLSPLPGQTLVTVESRGSHLWMGGNMLTYFDGISLHQVRPSDRESFPGAMSIREQPDGGLWMFTPDGLTSIPASEIRKFLSDHSYHVQYRLYNAADGIPGTMESGFFSGTDGRLWFRASGGVAWVDSSEHIENTVAPPVSIVALENGNKSYNTEYSSPDSLRLPPLPGNIRIAFTALSLAVPSRVQFRYRLEGVDKQWQDSGTRREAFYSNLAPGRYSFRVIACNNDGVWNTTGATLDFRVAPAWYQTVLFRVLCTSAAFSLLWAAYRLRIRRISAAMSARFDERLAERTRLARDMHDTLLQTIQGSKLLANNALKKADPSTPLYAPMEQLSQWLARATDEGRTALYSLRAANTETSDLAAAIRRTIHDHGAEFATQATLQLIGEQRTLHPIAFDELLMIASEAIRNAVAHSGCDRLEVILNYAHDLSMTIRDNGQGIDPSTLKKGKPGHFGLQSMRERSLRMGAELSIASALNAGTTIRIVVQGSIAYRKSASSRPGRMKMAPDNREEV